MIDVFRDFKVAFSRAVLRTYANSKIRKSRNDVEYSQTRAGVDFTISITTFENRFEPFALPLVKEIRKHCSNPIIVVINGNYDRPIDKSKLSNFLNLLNEQTDVFPVVFTSFQGWASLINTGIRHSASEVTFLFNDDIYLDGRLFMAGLTSHTKRILESGLGLINGSWSHFGISRSCIFKIGFFDERFLGIGEEDGDYQIRYQEFFKREVEQLVMPGMINLVHDSREESIVKGVGKYSLFNKVFSEVKAIHQLQAFDQADLLYWRVKLLHLLTEPSKVEVRREIIAALDEMKKYG